MSPRLVALPDILNDAVITEYAAGTLSLAKHFVIACHAELNPAVNDRISFRENIAASLLDDVRSVPLTPFFLGHVLSTLPYGPAREKAANDRAVSDAQARQAPRPLRKLLDGQGLRDIAWRSLVPGVAVYDVLGNRRFDEGDRLYLLRAKGGMQMPEHSHTGEEWTLILKGAYSVGDSVYERGALHIEDASETHSPYIHEGEDCICLVMAQGPLKMSGFVPKVVQKIVGI